MKRNYFLLMGLIVVLCSWRAFFDGQGVAAFAEETENEDTIVFRDAFTEEDIARKFENYTETVVAFDAAVYYGVGADSIGNLKCEGRVVGVVYDENTGDFLVNATVSFEELGLSVSTGEGGRFDVVNLPDGRYTITVHADGYQDAVYQDMPVSHSVGVDIYSLAVSKKHGIVKDFGRVEHTQENREEDFGELGYTLGNEEVRSVSAIPTIPKVTLYDNGEIRTYTNNLNHYLYYVVAIELRNYESTYSKEQLKEGYKAQAVAARTYVVSHAIWKDRHAKDGYDVCSDSNCCQAYKHGYCNLVTIEAVDETENEVVCTSDSSRICGVAYFNTCPGYTTSSLDKWGRDLPYLVSVECPYHARSDEKGGHGVGMCQNGAIGMSGRGYLYEEILEHYYYMTTVITANPYTD